MSNIVRIATGSLIGAGIGYAVYAFIGCRTGACPLTANLYASVLIYTLLGAFVVGKR